MSGKYNAELSKQISMKKSKALAKTMGLTFNDLIMGLVSKSIKTHFIAQGDSSEEISVAVPFTFQSIP